MLGEAIRAARKKRRWSQSELARRSGVSQSHISLLEAGNRDVAGGDVLQKLAGALETTVDALLGNDQAPRTPTPADLDRMAANASPKLRDLLEQMERNYYGASDEVWTIMLRVFEGLITQDSIKQERERGEAVQPPAPGDSLVETRQSGASCQAPPDPHGYIHEERNHYQTAGGEVKIHAC